jgi:hypothetical protein
MAFMGLTGYYAKFVKNYGKIVAPLTNLLKKNSFTWNPIVDHSFQAFKEAKCTTHVLSLLDFTKIFVLECDFVGRGIGAVLGKMVDLWTNQYMKRKCWLF